MTILSTARAAYSQPGTPTRTMRGTEHEVIARITQRLKAAVGKADTDFPGLAAALTENLQLWTTLAVEVADEANALPQQLRAQLFWLYRFTDRHTNEVLAGRGEAGVLVDINLAVMRGLRGETMPETVRPGVAQ